MTEQEQHRGTLHLRLRELILRDIGDLFLHVFAFHDGNSFLWVEPRFGDAVLRLHLVVGGVRAALRCGCSRHRCREHGTVCRIRTCGL